MRRIFVLALIAVLQRCSAHPQNVARQLIMPGAIPVPTTSSSFNWWPYPPGGTTAEPAVPTPNAPPTTAPDAVIMSLGLPPERPPPTSDANTDGTSTSSDSSSSSSSTRPSSSLSVITITPNSGAPVPTLVRYPKKSPVSQSPEIVYYLIPVFALVGLILGSVCAWFAWGCCTRKPRAKKNVALEVGPAYGSRHWDEAAKLRDDDDEDHIAPQDRPYSWADVEKESFLSPLPPAKRVSSRKPLSRNATTKTSASMSVYSQVGDDDDDEEEVDEFLNGYESEDDHPRRRAPHIRENSDYGVQRGRSNASTSTWGWGALSPGLATPASGVQREKSLGGFRIMQESPLPTPNLNPFGRRKEEEDRYTELPRRGSRSRSPTKRSPVKSRLGQGRGDDPVARRHPLLMQSPRQITSPKLDGVLCFTPSMNADTSARYDQDVEPFQLEPSRRS